MRPDYFATRARVACIALAGGSGDGGGRQPLPFTDIFLNEISGNNANPGTALLPIRDNTKLNQISFNRKLTANTTITYQVEDTTGIPLELAVDLGTFNLTVNMAPVLVHAGGTIDAGTIAINPTAGGGGQRQTLHTSDIADWTPFVLPNWGGTATHANRVVDTVTGGIAWLAGVGAPAPSAPGVATASVGRPWDATTTVLTPLTIGDAYRIERGGQLTLGSSLPLTSGGIVTFNDVEFTSASIGFEPVGDTAILNRCSFQSFCQIGATCFNCALPSSFSGLVAPSVLGGVLDPTSTSGIQILVMTGDVFVSSRTGNGLIVGPGTVSEVAIIASGHGDAGAQFSDNRGINRAGIILLPGGAFEGFALMWGNNNDGFGVLVAPGAHYWLNAFASPPTVTGNTAPNDFAFFSTLDPVTPTVVIIGVARAWNPAAGAYTEAGGAATRTTTWAHLAAAIGAGGFFGHATCLETDSSIVITGRFI